MSRTPLPENERRRRIKSIRKSIERLDAELAKPDLAANLVNRLIRARNESFGLLLRLEGMEPPIQELPASASKRGRGRPPSKLPVRVERSPTTGDLIAIYRRRVDGEMKYIPVVVPDSKTISGLSREAASRLTHGLLESHLAAAATALGARVPDVHRDPVAPPRLPCGCRSEEAHQLLGCGGAAPQTPPALTPRSYSEVTPTPAVPVPEITEPKAETPSVNEAEPVRISDERVYSKPVASFDPVTGFGLRLSRKS